MNVEIKARVPDLSTVRARASAIVNTPPERLDQIDTFFASSSGRLKVREFGDGSGELIAYERADAAGPRESVYTRVPCADARLLVSALCRVLTLRGRVVKRREVFMAGRTRIHLDDVEDLGCFVELEVVLDEGEAIATGEREARGLMDTLGITQSSLERHAYIDLLEQIAR